MRTGLLIAAIAMMYVPVFFGAAPVHAEAASRVQEQQFFESLNDVPLMPGLYEMLEESVVFDKPEGRIAESAAASQELALEDIRAFYSRTLPQMGWVRAADGTFVRDEESLTMNVENRDGYNVVRFMISPR